MKPLILSGSNGVLLLTPPLLKSFLENPPTGGRKPPRHRPSLLIVDDESNITKALARSLRLDFDVVTANSAEEALRLLKKKDFKIILTDQRMPGMTGIELLRQGTPITADIGLSPAVRLSGQRLYLLMLLTLAMCLDL